MFENEEKMAIKKLRKRGKRRNIFLFLVYWISLKCKNPEIPHLLWKLFGAIAVTWDAGNE